MSKAKMSFCVMAATMLTVMTLFFLPEPQARIIQTAIIQPGIVQKTYMLDGEVSYRNRQPVMVAVGGRIEQVCVQSGQWVEKGQLLLRLSTEMEETALARLQHQWYQVNDHLNHVTELQTLNASLLTDLISQQETLLASISLKQIRAAFDGRIENLYVSEGEYLSEAGLAGMLSGRELRISTVWLSQNGTVPVPGMRAWWCDSYGNKLEPLVLESIGAPVMQNALQAYPLVFSCVQHEQSSFIVGDKAPVCLVIEEQMEKATVSIEAMDENQQLWLVYQGTIHSVPVDLKACKNDQLLLPDELAGCIAVLHPESWELYEGMKVNLSEGM